MRLIVIEHDSLIMDVSCPRELIYLGHADSCRVHIPDSRLGEQQMVFRPNDDDGWMVEQLHPKTEFSLNGMNVTSAAPVKNADEIQILDFTIRVFPDATEMPAMSPSATARPELGATRLAFERFVTAKLPPTAIVKKAEEGVGIGPGQVIQASKATLAASQCMSVETLMEVAFQSLFTIFSPARVWIGIRRVNYGAMEYVEGRTAEGLSSDLPEIIEQMKPRVLDRGQFIVVPMLSPEERISIMTGPLLGPEGTLGMIYVDTGERERKYDPRDLDFFIVVTTLLAVQLDAIFRDIAANRNARIEGEISVAHEIQARLTPRKLPQWDELQFGAFREPGRTQTGDIYDIVRMQNGMAAILVARTPTTGALPSMLISQAQMAFRSAVMHNDAPNMFMRMLNFLLSDGTRDQVLDCFMGIIDPKTGEMRFALAGNIGAYIIGSRGDEHSLRPTPALPPLGLDKSTSYPLMNAELGNSESLALFTPGVTTAKSKKDEVFGEVRFVELLADGFGQLASAMLKEMLSDLRNFTEGGSQPDDITVILAHRL